MCCAHRGGDVGAQEVDLAAASQDTAAAVSDAAKKGLQVRVVLLDYSHIWWPFLFILCTPVCVRSCLQLERCQRQLDAARLQIFEAANTSICPPASCARCGPQASPAMSPSGPPNEAAEGHEPITTATPGAPMSPKTMTSASLSRYQRTDSIASHASS